MKKLILIGLTVAGISSMAYAASQGEECKGTDRFVQNLDLDEARAYEVEQILSSYKQVRELAMSGQHEQIPVFIEEKNAELAVVLSDEEMQQFKENIGEWAEGKDFSQYMNSAGKHFPKKH